MNTINNSKNHHNIPQVYYKQWSNDGKHICLKKFDSKTGELNIIDNKKNIKTYNYTLRGNTIKFGDIYMPRAIVSKYKKIIDRYKILVNGKRIKCVRKLSANYYKFDQWEVAFIGSDNYSTYAKNTLHTQIEQIKDNTIEEKWAKIIDNKFPILIQNVDKAIKIANVNKKLAKDVKKFFISFLLRSDGSFSQVDKEIELLCQHAKQYDLDPDNIKREAKLNAKRIWANETFDSIYRYIKSIYDTVKDKGVVIHYVNDPILYTSENPVFRFEMNNNKYIFILSPNYCITIEDCSNIVKMNKKICDEINNSIARQSKYVVCKV